MMVKSAPKSVSKTLSKPRRRSAAASLPVTRVPMGMPNSSPSATRTAGAGCTTTCLVGIVQGVPNILSVSSFSCSAPTGQATMHWPQLMQPTSRQLQSKAGSMIGVEAAIDGADDADLLHIVAGGDAAAAQNAFVVVRAQWKEKIVHRQLGLRALEA